jgi:hypothetical protein
MLTATSQQRPRIGIELGAMEQAAVRACLSRTRLSQKLPLLAPRRTRSPHRALEEPFNLERERERERERDREREGERVDRNGREDNARLKAS